MMGPAGAHLAQFDLRKGDAVAAGDGVALVDAFREDLGRPGGVPVLDGTANGGLGGLFG